MRMTLNINLYLSPEERQALDAMCKAKDLKPPDVIREALRAYGPFPAERKKAPRGAPMASEDSRRHELPNFVKKD